MVVGIDVYHDSTRKAGSIAGVVCSMNDACTKYFSLSVEQKQGQEIMDALRIAFIEGLIKYWEVRLVFYFIFLLLTLKLPRQINAGPLKL